MALKLEAGVSSKSKPPSVFGRFIFCPPLYDIGQNSMLPSSTSSPLRWTSDALLLQMRRFVTFFWNHLPVRCVGTPIAPGSSVKASSDTHTQSCCPLSTRTVSNQ